MCRSNKGIIDKHQIEVSIFTRHISIHQFWSLRSIISFVICIVLAFPIVLQIRSVSVCDLYKHMFLYQTLSVEQRAEKILRHSPLIDGHNDLMRVIRSVYGNHIYNFKFTVPFEDGGMPGHVDLPRLTKGMNGGAFWSAFVPCPKNETDFSDTNYAWTVKETFHQLDLFKRLGERYPKYFTPVRDSKEAAQAFKRGDLISPTAIEGLHQIGNSISNLRAYYELGVRYATLTWNCHNKYADAALVSSPIGETIISTPIWHGLSPAGRDLIKEMNRLGMIVDLSHVSQNTMRDALIGLPGRSWNGSIAPPIFSHSSAYAICPHPRNVPDDVLQLIKQRNSIVMVNFNPSFISCIAGNSSSGLPDLYRPNVTMNQVIRHIKHIGELIGYDHVGLGTDYDGINDTPAGLEDVSRFPDLVAELLRQGISDRDVRKIISGNILRVWKEVDSVASRLQKEILPLEDDLIPLRD